MKLKTLIAIFTILAAGATVSCGRHDHSLGTGELDAPLDSVFGAIFDADGIAPGATVIVTRGDSLIYKRSYGYADLGQQKPVNDSTMFNIAGLSQEMTAVGILKLQEEGKLSLNDSLPMYVPMLTKPFFGKVQLRHVLNHTSGIRDNRPRSAQEWDEYIAGANDSQFGRFNDYLYFSRTDESRLAIRSLDSLLFEPGSDYVYSTPPYEMMFFVVSVATGEHFEAWMHNNIFTPAGMEKVAYFHQDNPQANIAHAYRPAGAGPSAGRRYGYSNGWEEYDYGETPFFPSWPDGGVFTTADDMIRWMTALESDSLISTPSRLACWTPYVDIDKDYCSSGYGFFVEVRPGMSRKIFNEGSNGGFNAYAATFPDRRVKYVILSNRADWDRSQAAAAVDSILASRRWI